MPALRLKLDLRKWPPAVDTAFKASLMLFAQHDKMVRLRKRMEKGWIPTIDPSWRYKTAVGMLTRGRRIIQTCKGNRLIINADLTAEYEGAPSVLLVSSNVVGLFLEQFCRAARCTVAAIPTEILDGC